MLGSFDNAL
jgi:WD40 repeat protein